MKGIVLAGGSSTRRILSLKEWTVGEERKFLYSSMGLPIPNVIESPTLTTRTEMFWLLEKSLKIPDPTTL